MLPAVTESIVTFVTASRLARMLFCKVVVYCIQSNVWVVRLP